MSSRHRVTGGVGWNVRGPAKAREASLTYGRDQLWPDLIELRREHSHLGVLVQLGELDGLGGSPAIEHSQPLEQPIVG